MAETTSQSRAAAIAVALLALGGVLAGVIVPKVVTQNHVEYGDWDGTSDPAARRCVTGTVWIEDDVRTLGRLPLIAEGAAPYCVYRACFDPGESRLAAFMEAATPRGMDPLFAEDEQPWQSGQPPLAVWCGGDEADEPLGCACRPRDMAALGTCEWLAQPIDGPEVWAPAPTGVTLARGRWRGNACVKAPCVVLAGREWFPPACAPAPAPPPVEPTP